MKDKIMIVTGFDTLERLQSLGNNVTKTTSQVTGWSGSNSQLPPSFGTGQMAPSGFFHTPIVPYSTTALSMTCQICEKEFEKIEELCIYYDEEINEDLMVCEKCLDEKNNYTSKW